MSRVFRLPAVLIKLPFSKGFFLITILSICSCSGPSQKEDYAEIDLRPGQSLNQLARNLESEGVIGSPWLFRGWVRVVSNYSDFKAGHYRVPRDVQYMDLIRIFLEGRVHHQKVLSITIPEGWNLAQIAELGQASGIGAREELLKLASETSKWEQVPSKAETLEGYLFPATYDFYDEIPTAAVFLDRLVSEFFRRLPQRTSRKGLSLHEWVTFASLIEKETAHESERRLVSEVIWNRLKKRQALGIDAAVIYGIKDYDGDIKTAHLRDRKNPYNTRIHRGLPPGPICSPSSASLQAVFEPTQEGYFYYVLVSGGRRHHFSSTLKEHNHFVRLLMRAQRKEKRVKREKTSNPNTKRTPNGQVTH